MPLITSDGWTELTFSFPVLFSQRWENFRFLLKLSKLYIFTVFKEWIFHCASTIKHETTVTTKSGQSPLCFPPPSWSDAELMSSSAEPQTDCRGFPPLRQSSLWVGRWKSWSVVWLYFNSNSKLTSSDLDQTTFIACSARTKKTWLNIKKSSWSIFERVWGSYLRCLQQLKSEV